VALIPAIRLDAAIRGDVLGGGFHRRVRAQGATLEQAKRTPVLDLNSRLGDAYALMRSLGTNLDGPLLFSVLDLDPVLRDVDLAHHDAAVTRTSTVEMQRELGLQEVARVPGPLAGLAGSWLSPFNNTLTAYVLDVVFLERPDDGEHHRWRITPILVEDLSGRPLDVPIAPDPPWQANGTPPDAVAPDGIDAYGSWSRAGTQTGRLQLGPFAAHGDLLLAYTTGRDASGLRLEFLLRRDDGPEERRLLTMFGSPGRWIGLRVTPALGHGGELTIVATDEGTGHDQWMALGLPLRVEPRVRLPGDP
jgi:hypothetical protein